MVGAAVEREQAIPVGEVLRRFDDLRGQMVVVTGEVEEVCQHVGCWFVMREGEQRIYVDLQGGKLFTVPKDCAGRRAYVLARVEGDAKAPRLIGKGVRLE